MGETRNPRRRRRRWPAVVALALAVLLLPPVRSRVKGALLVAQVVPSPVRPLQWVTPDPRRSEIALAGGRADLYRPRGLSGAPGLVLLHGANPEGKDDARIRMVADAFARAGRRVVVPNLELRHERLDLEDLDRIRSAVQSLGRHPVGVVAFSYGAALGLVALGGEDGPQDRITFAATFGTYFDLLNLVQGVTTGVVPSPRGPVPWRTEPEALDLAAQQLAALLGGADEAAFLEAWKDRDPGRLGPGPRAVYDLLVNRDPGRVQSLFARLPQRSKDLLTSLSPSSVAAGIRFPVFALHSREDPAAPPAESELLLEAVPHPESRLVEVGIFRHVTPVASPLTQLGDGVRLVRFAGMVLAAQEGLPRP